MNISKETNELLGEIGPLIYMESICALRFIVDSNERTLAELMLQIVKVSDLNARLVVLLERDCGGADAKAFPEVLP
jgi:hypothetical protein